jgi:hypothetical protein
MKISDIIGKKIGIKCEHYNDIISFYDECKHLTFLNLYINTLGDVKRHLQIFKHVVIHISESNILEYGNENFYKAHNFNIIKNKKDLK